jgi:hypothetical protein
MGCRKLQMKSIINLPPILLRLELNQQTLAEKLADIIEKLD